nr:sulfate adenylyltransferase subunit CysN [Pararhodospirillum photometricum]
MAADFVADVEARLRARETKTLLRFLTCGSVDDGKSSLIGRLLYDSKALFDDQMSSLAEESARFGTTGTGHLDLALLVDGLTAEREQGITIDVAYRYFATEKRSFIVADTPGHEQYTRNMATGASTAEVAVLLADARKGVLTQTRRHATIVSLLGIRHVVLAVNKMDLVGWDEATFTAIARDFKAFAAQLGISHVTCIPVSALLGDNVTRPSPALPWYSGPTLLGHLETVDVSGDETNHPWRLPVQWVNRPDASFRGFSGTLVSGVVRPGDKVVVLPSGRTTKVARLVTQDGDLERAQAGDAVTLVLADEIDVARGDVLAAAEARPVVAEDVVAHVVWLAEPSLAPGQSFLLRLGTATVGATVSVLHHRVNINTLEHTPARHLELNDVAVCTLHLDRPLPFEPYADNRALGGFILIDRHSNATLACGMIDFAQARATDLHRHPMKVDKTARARANGQQPVVIWFTGLSGAGKSTVADLVEQRLHALGRRTMSLDGDAVRHGLNRDLGFDDADRTENIRRVAEVAKLMTEAGLITLVSFISPFREDRRLARGLMGPGEFIEVFVDAPLAVCEARDPKGLYAKARAGKLPGFTGIDSTYEPPEAPELHLDAGLEDAAALAERVIVYLQERGIA